MVEGTGEAYRPGTGQESFVTIPRCAHATYDVRHPAPGIVQSRYCGRSATVIAPDADSSESVPGAWVVLVRVCRALPLVRSRCRTAERAAALVLLLLTGCAGLGCEDCWARAAHRRRAAIQRQQKGP